MPPDTINIYDYESPALSNAGNLAIQGRSFSDMLSNAYSSYSAHVCFDADQFELREGGGGTFSGRDILFKLQRLEATVVALELENKRLEKQLKLYILKENSIDE